jgi:hypothetical protein
MLRGMGCLLVSIKKPNGGGIDEADAAPVVELEPEGIHN